MGEQKKNSSTSRKGRTKSATKSAQKNSKAMVRGAVKTSVKKKQNFAAKKRQLPIEARRNRATVTVKPTNGKFAEGLSFKKLFFIFLICSVAGAIYEDILIFIKTWLTTGTGVWMLHRGVIYGPFNVIYGLGAAMMCWILLRKKYNNWQIFGIAALLGGVVEYLLSFFQELVIGTRSWDYSDEILNIAGRTTIPFMIVWGLLGLAIVKLVYPFLSAWIERIPERVGNPLFWVLLIFMIFDCLISWSAVIRQTMRHNDIPPFTPIGEFYDSYYDDDFLKTYYPNMERTSK